MILPPYSPPMTSPNDILLSSLDEHGVLRLTLNDTARRNALSEGMIGALHGAITSAGETKDVRVIIIAAHGPAFSAGHDLKELTNARTAPDKGRAFFAEIMTRCSNLMQAIVNCPKPVIAEVAGVATAAGCQLVASCDLAIAAETARFATPGVNIGLFCSTPMVALSRNVSRKHAMDMLLTGEMIPAARAEAIGLINRVVPAEKLTDAATQLARTIAAKSAHTLAVGKGAFYRQADMALPEAYDYASQVMTENMLAVDAEEGIGAFLEKRDPQWRDE